jgi:hypothetical protein
MVTLRQTSLVSVTTIAFCGAALLNTAFAAPPARASGAHGMMAAGTTSAPAAQLDLRPPSDAFDSVARDSARFPSSLHRQSLSALQQTAGQASPLQILGSESSTTRTPGRLEEFAGRVRREGLPIARLWQNKSSVLSLGLNQRGKPGLWFVQKLR